MHLPSHLRSTVSAQQQRMVAFDGERFGPAGPGLQKDSRWEAQSHVQRSRAVEARARAASGPAWAAHSSRPYAEDPGYQGGRQQSAHSYTSSAIHGSLTRQTNGLQRHPPGAHLGHTSPPVRTATPGSAAHPRRSELPCIRAQRATWPGTATPLPDTRPGLDALALLLLVPTPSLGPPAPRRCIASTSASLKSALSLAHPSSPTPKTGPSRPGLAATIVIIHQHSLNRLVDAPSEHPSSSPIRPPSTSTAIL
ncbi:hypothetical protein PaG_04129 [Moesziomyces aphidis]|uniref:Uncharacterized protein n=1 Tax=Moesziomyces aphidis TaxID=84754 RepID=W3VLG1_MOEAP|nr:hypothetical protein PaG_04129 [Moesziomyces aphidis]